MSKKEFKTGEIIARVIEGMLTQAKASEELGISIRQVKRQCKKYKKNGLEGLTHKSRGKKGNRKISDPIREKIIGVIKERYSDFGPQLVKEQLEETHMLKYSREWLRQLMIDAEIWKAKKKKFDLAIKSLIMYHLNNDFKYIKRTTKNICPSSYLRPQSTS